MAELTGAETKVWILLFRDTKAEAGLARTGQADLARRAGLSVRGVQKTIAKLVRRGLLRIIRRGRLNAGPTVYRVFATGGESTPA
jgi:DNA-binding MarR family transcriptional regulator